MAALVTQVVLRLGRQHILPAVGSVYVCKRDASTNLATYKRGRGGRSSFSGIVATVFGASGFAGRHVVNKLGKIGSQVIVPYRGDGYAVDPLKVAGDLGQILFFPYHLQDDDSIRKVMKYSNVVVNMVGRDWQTKSFNFNDVHVDGARRIASLAREVGVEKLVHFSAMSVTPTPESFYVNGGSRFIKSKYYGEEAVRDEFPDAIIFRPADMYGQGDRFLSLYASPWRRGMEKMALWKKGDYTLKRPVYVQDVAQGVINAIQDPDAVGKTFECVGPQEFYLSDLVHYIYSCMRWDNFKLTRMTPLIILKALLLDRSPSTPIYSLERLDREFMSDKMTGCPTLEDLGVKLTKVEDQLPWELKPYRRHAYMAEEVGQFPDPEPPPTSTQYSEHLPHLSPPKPWHL